MNTHRIPFIKTGMALQSLRDSGYSLAAALGEPIDNSIEANANNIWVFLEEAANDRSKKCVHRIAMIDDGDGMDQDTLHQYLQLGFSSRYMSTKTIGKYGVGAKLAALNFGRRIDVWSRPNPDQTWLHVAIDLDELLKRERDGEELGIDPPDAAPVPQDLVGRLPEGSGTVVLWSKVDRLEEGRHAADANALRVEVEKELSRIFRYFLSGGIRICVNNTTLLPHDPLFRMETTWADKALVEHYKDRKQIHFPADVITEKEEIKIGGRAAYLTVTLYPKEVARRRFKGRDTLATKLRVPENEGAISFVRLNREVSYTNVPRIFPFGVEERDRYIGIEVAFTPELDEYFGVRNVKRGVEPHGELRDQIRKRLRTYIKTARDKLEEIWGQEQQETGEVKDEHDPVTQAVKEIELLLPKSRAKVPADIDRAYEDLAKDVLGDAPEAEKKRYIESIQELPVVVVSVDFPGTDFIDIQHLGFQVLIRLNTRHRFYREMWGPIQEIAKRQPASVSQEEAIRVARRTIEALTLMIIAYGKAESMHPVPYEQYGELRSYWGKFLATMMSKVKNVV